MQVALERLAESGVPGFTTRRIAAAAGTSPAAVYELFGDKAGLVRELFFEGFRMLRRRYDAVPSSADPRDELVALAECFRDFVRENPVLAERMFSRPFADFDPEPADSEAGASVRTFIVERVQRCIEAGVLTGDAVDLAHVFVALCQGLAANDLSGRLGGVEARKDRRWRLGVEALIRGASPPDRPWRPHAATPRAGRARRREKSA